MAISKPEALKGFHNTISAMGKKSINSDAYLEIEGHADLSVLCKQFPWPVLGPSGEIEIPGPMGSLSAIPAQVKTYQQGPVTLSETQSGRVMRFMEDVLAAGGVFQAKVYEGTPQAFTRGYRLLDCFFVPDNPDRDWENRAQVTQISGTLHFHFYGDKLQGNTSAM